jgi:mannose-6-phosphate isomerase-like protein (cupin superfamily)
MAQLVVSTGVDGRSTVISRQPLEPGPQLTVLWDFDLAPMEVPPVAGEATDIGVPPGRGRWMLLRQQPGAATPDHHTMTMDLFIVLEGSADLLLDDGPVALTPGDHVRCEGAAHGWRWGPDGCTLAVLNLGAVSRPAT